MSNYLRWVTGPLLVITIWVVASWEIDSLKPDYPPTTILLMASLAGCGLIAGMTLERRNSVVRILVFVALCGVDFGCLASLRDRPAVRFWAAYRAIQVGMTAHEVDAVIATHHRFRKPPVVWSDEDRTPGIDDFRGEWSRDVRTPGGELFQVDLHINEPPFRRWESFAIKLSDGRVVDKSITTTSLRFW